MTLLCIDAETNGLNIASNTFQILSTAFYYEDGREVFTKDFNEACELIKAHLEVSGNKLLVYNLSFEGSIFLKYGLVRDFSQIVDVWRLVNYVNNDSEDRKTSLNASVQKFLGIDDFKEPFFKKMIELGFAKDNKDAHRKIAMLPDDLLKEYNILDVVYTMRLYHYCIDKLKAWGYLDYARDDYKLYSVESLLYSKSYLRGIEIDRALCFSNLTELNLERDALITEVYEHEDILAYEKVINRDVCLTDADARKWLKANGIVAPIKKGTGVALLPEEVAEDLLEAKKSRFNLRSSKQLREFFIETLKFPILKLTDGGDASMDKHVLKEYGELGARIARISDLTKEVEEIQKLLFLSREDNMLHPTLRSGSTLTGRTSSKI